MPISQSFFCLQLSSAISVRIRGHNIQALRHPEKWPQKVILDPMMHLYFMHN